MTIESRVKKIEDTLGVTKKPQTLSEILDAFSRGEYGNIADLFRLILSGLCTESENCGYPPELVSYLLEQHKGNIKKTEPDRA